MAYVDTGDVVSGTIITEGWGDQVRANFQAGVPAIFTTKGDLAVATAAETAARLGVGADDATLVADSFAATGLAWQIQPAARVYRNVAFDPTPTAWDTIDFTHERFDTDGMWVIGTPSRLTVPAGGDGLYLIGGQVSLGSLGLPGGNSAGARILLDGTTVIAQIRDDPDRLSDREVPLPPTLYALTVGQFVELQVYTTSDVNVLSSGNYSPEFWAIWQRRA